MRVGGAAAEATAARAREAQAREARAARLRRHRAGRCARPAAESTAVRVSIRVDAYAPRLGGDARAGGVRGRGG